MRSRLTVLTIARLTVREAARRRLLLALLILTALVIAATGWGFSRISTLSQPSGPAGADQLVQAKLSVLQVRLVAAQLLVFVMYMFSFVLALSAVFAAAPAVSGEVESGIALAVLARPLRRRDYLVGKWLGLAGLVAAYAALAIGAELATVQAVIGYLPPEPAQLVLYLIAEGLVCLTLALALSTRLSGLVGGVIALVLFGVAWLGGVVGGLGAVFASEAITQIGTASRIIMPTDLLWRGAVWSLEPAATRALVANAGPAALATPFFAAAPPEAGWLVWAAAWLAGVLGLAVFSFQRREV